MAYVRKLLFWPLRLAALCYQWCRKRGWLRERPIVGGVQAVPLTPRGELVLVRLNYAKGWRFPGGGREAGEDARAAILRELREEIGLTGYGKVEMLQHTMEGEEGFLFLI